MKAILIVDIDEKIHNSTVNSIRLDNNETIVVMKDLKFKPMPKRLDMSKVDGSNLLDLGYMHGRNDLINEMEGEEK